MNQAAPPNHHRQAIVMLLVANLLWGVSFPLIKSLVALQERFVPGGSTWFIAAFNMVPRFAIGTIVLAVFNFRALRTLTRSEWKQGLGLALFASAGMAFQNDGLQFTSATTSAFLTQFYAIMIPIFIAIVHRRAPPWTVWISCGLVVAGVAVLARLDWHDLRLGRGEVETLVSSVFFMGQILWLERKEFAGNRALPVTMLMFALQAVIAGALAAGFAPRGVDVRPLLANGPWIGFTLALTVFCTLGSFTLMNAFQPRITATEAGLLYCSEPVFTAMLALFVPAWFSRWGDIDYANEAATVSLLLGGGLITVANILVQLKPPEPPARAA